LLNLRFRQRQVLCACLIGSSPILAQADFYLHRWDDQFQDQNSWNFHLHSMYYSSGANFTPGVSYTEKTLLKGSTGTQAYYRFQNDLLMRWGVVDKLSLFGRLSWANIHISNSAPSSSITGFADQSVGLTYRVYEGQKPKALIYLLHFDFQFQADVPAYRSSYLGGFQSPALGDGSTDLTGGAFVEASLFENPQVELSSKVGAGYTYRTKLFSAALPWIYSIQVKPRSSSWIAEIMTFGILSLRTDPYGFIPQSFRNNYDSGGSFMIGGVNPSQLQVGGKLGYRTSAETQISIAMTQSVLGQASPVGTNIVLGFQSGWGKGQEVLETHSVENTPSSFNISETGIIREARVIRTNERMNLVKIDKGSQNGIEVGHFFEFFPVSKEGTIGKAVARGQVTSIKPEEAAVTVMEYYDEVYIEVGFSAKQLIH
jgi:hypothetical protein